MCWPGPIRLELGAVGAVVVVAAAAAAVAEVVAVADGPRWDTWAAAADGHRWGAVVGIDPPHRRCRGPVGIDLRWGMLAARAADRGPMLAAAAETFTPRVDDQARIGRELAARVRRIGLPFDPQATWGRSIGRRCRAAVVWRAVAIVRTSIDRAGRVAIGRTSILRAVAPVAEIDRALRMSIVRAQVGLASNFPVGIGRTSIGPVLDRDKAAREHGSPERIRLPIGPTGRDKVAVAIDSRVRTRCQADPAKAVRASAGDRVMEGRATEDRVMGVRAIGSQAIDVPANVVLATGRRLAATTGAIARATGIESTSATR